MIVARACAIAGMLLALARPALAQCPPDCVGGGKAPATDCLAEFGGITTPDDGCTDGNPACDTDGIVNGVCTFGLFACLNVAGDPSCVPGASKLPVVRPARSPAAQALAGALASLDPTQSGCTAPGLEVPLATSLAGVKPGIARLAIVAGTGGKRDRNKLKLTCRPSPTAPSLSGVIKPTFAAHCALPACHTSGAATISPQLDSPAVRTLLVDVPSTNVPSLSFVHPGSVLQSYLGRKILGKRIPDHTPRMPDGCPKVVPAGGCLTNGEIAAIAAWIQFGAPDN